MHGFEFLKIHNELRNTLEELSFSSPSYWSQSYVKSNMDKQNSIRMQTKEGKNKLPNQYKVSSKLNKNKDKELKHAVLLIPLVITLKYVVFMWNDNSA